MIFQDDSGEKVIRGPRYKLCALSRVCCRGFGDCLCLTGINFVCVSVWKSELRRKMESCSHFVCMHFLWQSEMHCHL